MINPAKCGPSEAAEIIVEFDHYTLSQLIHYLRFIGGISNSLAMAQPQEVNPQSTMVNIALDAIDTTTEKVVTILIDHLHNPSPPRPLENT